MSDPPQKSSLFEELKRRNVYRVAAMYAVVGWLLLQVGEVTFDPLGLPHGSLRLLIILVAVGFPVTLVLGWLFDWTSDGLVRTPDDPGQAVARLQSHRHIDFAIIGVLALALGMSLFGPEIQIAPVADEPIRSIAVLPLDNLSSDPEQEYFADGMTEALIAELAQIGSLRVISRTSVMQYKGARKALPEIAAELDVAGILEGSVMRVGDRVRVTAQLIDARHDEHLWAHRYDRDLREILELQSEISRAVADQIRLQLTQEVSVVEPPVVHPDAHDAYLKGRYLYAKSTYADSLRAVEYFEEAIRIDPNFALAYAGLADAYS